MTLPSERLAALGESCFDCGYAYGPGEFKHFTPAHCIRYLGSTVEALQSDLRNVRERVIDLEVCTRQQGFATGKRG